MVKDRPYFCLRISYTKTMRDLTAEQTPTSLPVASKVKLKGTVGKRHESWLAGLARKKSLQVAMGALGMLGIASGAVGAARASDSDPNNGVVVKVVPKALKEEAAGVSGQLFDKVFHNSSKAGIKEAREKVNIYKDRLKNKTTYDEEHRYIPEKYKDVITQAAELNGISEAALMGVISVENGGSEDEGNPSGARGVGQFLPDTARQYGLKVEGDIDERTDPVKSIKATALYLHDLKNLFGDEGIAIWGYHAGQGNVLQALEVYFSGLGIEVHNFAQAREQVIKNGLNVNTLLSDGRVQREVTSHLNDYSDTYPFQVIATAELLQGSPRLVAAR